jgi:hypothetical protein
MFPFSKFGSFDRGECKALLAAGAACLFFISVFVVIRPRPYVSTVPIPPKKPLVSSAPVSSGDSFETYRIKTEDFYDVDFWNYSYGSYTLSDGKKIPLTLTNTALVISNTSDTFALKDVYYKDVTGDGRAEAIVWISHVNCAGPCNDSNVFYIYTVKNRQLKPIWQYETGSYAHGCGLKSLTLSGTQIILELFGDCTKQIDDPRASEFIVKKSTFILLEFDGRGFRQQSSEVVEISPTRVTNYQPRIRMF